MPRTASHDDYMDDYDWFCYFPSRNFKGTTNPLFNYPFIGKNLWVSQYGYYTGAYLPGWFPPPSKNSKLHCISQYQTDKIRCILGNLRFIFIKNI